jgi:hypothetical protein
MFVVFDTVQNNNQQRIYCLKPVPIEWETWWAPETVWTTWRSENSLSYQESNSEPSIFQLVASRSID